jgi:hypothetical protein
MYRPSAKTEQSPHWNVLRHRLAQVHGIFGAPLRQFLRAIKVLQPPVLGIDLFGMVQRFTVQRFTVEEFPGKSTTVEP